MQAMTGSESSPIAYNTDQPFSLMKHTERPAKMAANRKQSTPTINVETGEIEQTVATTPVAETPVEPTPVAETPVEHANVDRTQFNQEQADEYDRLVADEKSNRARIKELKAAKKAQKDAEKAANREKSGVIGGATINATKAIAARVAKRIKSGASQEDALSAEWALLRGAIMTLLDTPKGDAE
jgi:hypothetical protein